jgi:hypothetical protein
MVSRCSWGTRELVSSKVATHVDERSFHQDGILDSSASRDPYGGACHGRRDKESPGETKSATTRISHC